MGSNCSHVKISPIEIFPKEYTETGLWTFKTAIVECKDCAKQFRAIQFTGNMTDYKGNWHIQDQDKCRHTIFDVNELKIELHSNNESKLWRAPASCVKCGCQFMVQSEYGYDMSKNNDANRWKIINKK